jgi:hypothetical protein
MKTKRFLVAVLMATSAYAIPFSAFQYDSPIRVMAQDKQFTLEDLNFGGHNYRTWCRSRSTIRGGATS